MSCRWLFPKPLLIKYITEGLNWPQTRRLLILENCSFQCIGPGIVSKDSECSEVSNCEYSKSEMNQERGEKVGPIPGNSCPPQPQPRSFWLPHVPLLLVQVHHALKIPGHYLSWPSDVMWKLVLAISAQKCNSQVNIPLAQSHSLSSGSSCWVLESSHMANMVSLKSKFH